MLKGKGNCNGHTKEWNGRKIKNQRVVMIAKNPYFYPKILAAPQAKTRFLQNIIHCNNSFLSNKKTVQKYSDKHEGIPKQSTPD
ncbi:hypothetical protein E3N88_41388 [Mikania micrantha]|uniref:Uncharacterized protein n=1 Tax=Mikania micrantha TaxID=192012 RepID=A0A5N6LR87_9ASTR|nr:hypothetical protein E3N88_41388 [Mikania micrantha]